jgi:hypothetical protein
MSAQTIRIVAAVFNRAGEPEIVRLAITPGKGQEWEPHIEDALAAAGYEPVPRWWLTEGAVQYEHIGRPPTTCQQPDHDHKQADQVPHGFGA